MRKSDTRASRLAIRQVQREIALHGREPGGKIDDQQFAIERGLKGYFGQLQHWLLGQQILRVALGHETDAETENQAQRRCCARPPHYRSLLPGG